MDEPGHLRPSDQGAKAIISAVKKAGVTRLLFMGGVGSLEVKPGVQSVDLPEFPKEWKQGALRLVKRSICYVRNRDWSGPFSHRLPICLQVSGPASFGSEPMAAWQDRLDERLYWGVWALGLWDLHPLSLMFAISGTLMIRKTLRIPIL